jgi:hypothetical protein
MKFIKLKAVTVLTEACPTIYWQPIITLKVCGTGCSILVKSIHVLNEMCSVNENAGFVKTKFFHLFNLAVVL